MKTCESCELVIGLDDAWILSGQGGREPLRYHEPCYLISRDCRGTLAHPVDRGKRAITIDDFDSSDFHRKFKPVKSRWPDPDGITNMDYWHYREDE